MNEFEIIECANKEKICRKKDLKPYIDKKKKFMKISSTYLLSDRSL